MSRRNAVPVTRSLLGVGADTITVGTTRLTNLSDIIEATAIGELAGGKILSVRGTGTLQALSAGVQDYTAALVIGPSTLDAADIDPGAAYAIFPWYGWRIWEHRGTQHNVTAAVSEFDVYPTYLHSRGQRRLPRLGSSLFLAEATTGQNQSANWVFEVAYTR